MMPTMPAGFIKTSLQWPPARDQLNDQHHNRDDEQDVNESAQGIGADESKEPEHQQDYKYGPEHKVLLVKSYVASSSTSLLRLSN